MGGRRSSSIVAGCVLLMWLSAGCTDDFSRFQFAKRVRPRAPRDAGAQNVSDETDLQAEMLGNPGSGSQDADDRDE
jgi:hypothetical protein